MDIAKRITELREEAGENRKEFSVHTGISVRTLEEKKTYNTLEFEGLERE